MIVVDASIVVKVLLDERDSAHAVAFLRQVEDGICGPDVLALEVCRAWVAAANARRIDAARVRRAIDHWLQHAVGAAITIHQTDAALMMQAVDLALVLGHPLSDCIYLALADRLGCPLATCDAKFRDRVADPSRVKLLAELV